VLGLATGGCFFSLLTLLFSGAMTLKTLTSPESCGPFADFQVFVHTRLLPELAAN
jgi:hypothetical protein